MNRNLYKLVFDTTRGIPVPTCEVAVARGKKGSRSRRIGVSSATVLLGVGLLVQPAGAAPPRGSLPVPATNFVSYGGGRIASDVATATGRAMTIEQSSQRAVFNWNRFDVASGSSVDFKQPSVSSIALNRIFDGKPSEIHGVIKANGQIYLINNNGIVFGGGAQVNVGGLIASSLNLSDSLFQAGLDSITKSRAPAFTDDGSAAIAGSAIKVAAGAEIKTASGGSILLFAPNVTNEGRLDATNGQVVLGGGYTVYMVESNNYATRGWMVEVDPRFLRDANGDPVKDALTQRNVVVASGEVTNRNTAVSAEDAEAIRMAIQDNDTARAAIDASFEAEIAAQKGVATTGGTAYSDSVISRAAERLGDVISRRGNVSMVGFAVNQMGRVSATTSVKANGSIFLKAQDSVSDSSGTTTNLAERAGALVLGVGSKTSVNAETTYDADGKEETQTRGETFNPSTIALSGHTVHLQQGAVVSAVGGNISVEAVKNPSKKTYEDSRVSRNDSRVVLESGASISAAGSKAVVVPGSRNQIAAELFSVQLADSPLQRSGILYRKAVNYDLRRGIKVANTTDYEKLVPITVGERTAAGGSVTIRSEGDIVIAKGANIDVSGGWLDYQQAELVNTYLYSARKRYDVSDAPANVVYTRKEDVTQTASAYTEGKDAGSVTLNAAALVLDGDIRGETRSGEFQRETGSSSPKGGRLVIGDVSIYRTPQTEIRETVDAFVPTTGESWLTAVLGARSSTTLLSSNLFAHGISRFELYSNGAIDQQIPINLGNGGAVTFVGNSVNVGASINAPGGKINISSADTSWNEDGFFFGGPGGNVSVASGVGLNVAGRWTNDLADEVLAPVANTAGSISLTASRDLLVGKESALNASAGAWLKANGNVIQGTPGSISLKSAQGNTSDGILDFSGATLSAFGFSKGGSLTLAAPNLTIGGLSTANGLSLDSGFFSVGGFGAFDLTGIGYAVLKAKTALNLRADGLNFQQDFRKRSGSLFIGDVTQIASLPVETRRSTDFTLSAVRGAELDSGKLRVETGASITTETQGKIALKAAHDMWVDGVLTAPAGNISLSLTAGPAAYLDSADLGKRVLWLGDNAQLLARGAIRPEANAAGLRKGEVLAGGAISLDASKLGFVLTEDGSLMDVSGTRAMFDITTMRVRSNEVSSVVDTAGDGGSIAVAGRHGAFLDGQMAASAGGAGAAAGSFSMTVDARPNDSDAGVGTVPTGYPRVGGYELRVASSGTVLPAGASAEAGVDALANLGKGAILAERLASAGFDDITLSSQNAIRFDSAASISTRRSLTIEAPALITDDDTLLTSGYLKWSNARQLIDKATDGGGNASSGGGKLTFAANLIDLVGDLVLNNASQASFTAGGDIRFQSSFFNVNNLLSRTGRLNALANVDFKAQQIYPTTASEFTVASPGMRVNFSGNGEASELPMSVNGSLTVEAGDISQGGVLRAPFGSIGLKATDQLDLLAGSITSVSGQGLNVPYGELQNGSQWIYPNPLGSGSSEVLNAVPEKAIVLEGAVVNTAAKSLVDVSGGGDVFGYEFVPGVGGSRDYLANSNVFAILPGYSAGYAPVDPVYLSGSSLKVGMQITLGAGAGLPAGTYTLLPARYGLLKGAYVVSAIGGYRDWTLTQSISQADGSAIVAGSLGTAQTGIIESRTSGFLVESSGSFLKRSEYRVYGANEIFSARNERAGTSYGLAKDAGRLTVAASSAMKLNGTSRLLADVGGLGGTFEISSPRIVLTDGGVYGSEFLKLDIDTLLNTGVATLVLGGQLGSSATEGESVLTAKASEVLIDTKGRALELPELIAVATDKVTVAEGSSVVAAGRGAVGNLLSIAGDGAALRVAGEYGARLVRSGVIGNAGDLKVESDVTLRGGTVELDAARRSDIFISGLDPKEGLVNIDAMTVSLGANSLRFGEENNADDLNIGNQLFKQLGKAGELLFRGYSGITFAPDYALNGDKLTSITLDSPLIKGEGGNALVKATDVYLTNSSNKSATGDPSNAGTLTIDAGHRVLVAPGTRGLAIRGFNAVELKGNEVVADGTGDLVVGTDEERSSLLVASGRLTTTTGADVGMLAKGTFSISQTGSVSGTPDGIGGHLKLTGASLVQSGTVELPAGVLEMTATAGDVTLAAGSVSRATGVSMDYGTGAVAYTDAGTVVLNADNGNVVIAGPSVLQPAAEVDVRAHEGGGSGGGLEVNATKGRLTMAGSLLKGTGGKGGTGGSFRVDVKELSSLDDVAEALAGKGFADRQDIRVRSGDLSLSAGKTMQASHLAMSIDSGKLNVAGTFDSSGDKGGEVRLFAKDDVTLSSTAKILANATGSDDKAQGGKVTIGSVEGFLDLQGGSLIDVSSPVGLNGEAVLRATRYRPDGKAVTPMAPEYDVKVKSVKSTFIGAAPILAAVKKYQATSISSIATYTNDTNAFMGNAGAIQSRLDSAGTTGLIVRPEIEISGTSDLALGVDWNLYSASRSGGQPGYLTLRAKDNLNLNKSISDGFENFTSNNLTFGDSWSYALVGGGDLTAADPLRTRSDAKSGTKGDVVFAKGVTVRTTTGDIDIAAGRDLKLSDVTSTIYTAGKPVEVVVNAVDGTGIPVDMTTPDGFAVSLAVGQFGTQPVYAPGTALAGAFTSGGGDIRIEAGRDAYGVADAQLATHWLWRQGDSESLPKNAAWWTYFTQFRQDIGSFGGGDVTIRTGRDIKNLSAMLPSNGRVSNTTGLLELNSGGDLSVSAGGDIAGGQYMVMGGDGHLKAGGALTQGGKTGDAALNPVLHLADGQFSLSARGDARIEAIVNPTVVLQNISNENGRLFFYTYTDSDAVTVISVTGDSALVGDSRLATFFAPKVSRTLPDHSGLSVLPANLTLASLSGDVEIGYLDKTSSLVMYPSSTGQLDLLAAGSVTFGNGTSIRLPDVSPKLPDAYSSKAQNLAGLAKGSIGGEDKGVSDSSGQVRPLHEGDQIPVRVIALSGDVAGSSTRNVLFASKPVHAEAGRDIVDFGVTAQNLDSDDVTSIVAGRDVRFSVPQGTDNKPQENLAFIEVRGGGLAYVESGRDTDLTTSGGIVTTGNLNNPSLSSSGADIRVLTGAKPVLDTTQFSEKYLSEGSAYVAVLGDYLNGMGLPAPANAAESRAAFLHLSERQRDQFAGQVLAAEFVARYLGSGSPFLSDWTAHATRLGDSPAVPKFSTVKSFWPTLLWAELKGAAADSASGGRTPDDYSRGLKALEMLGLADVFKHDGDLNLLFSQIKSRRGGDIELLVPGGKLNVGLASVGTLTKDADKLGIISEGEGEIRIAAQSDILVNSSRIFSMGGGDMLLWTSDGDIDAGKGAKTTIVLPEPVRNENNEWEYPAGGSGSGIAAIEGRSSVRKAKVALLAPKGTINAGDAGIRSSGNLDLRARLVLGADNIRAGGAITGAPAAPAVSAPAVSIPAAASTEASKSLDDMAATSAGNKGKESRSILTVEVVGVGDESDEERNRRRN